MPGEFLWPSNQARADNKELDRVCDYLESVIDERDALESHLKRIRSKRIKSSLMGGGYQTASGGALAAAPGDE